jgi:hypothetical protein
MCQSQQPNQKAADSFLVGFARPLVCFGVNLAHARVVGVNSPSYLAIQSAFAKASARQVNNLLFWKTT